VKSPKVGMGYRVSLHNEIVNNIEGIEVLEITLDHFISAHPQQKELFTSLLDFCPLVSHGIGLSLGTDEPVNTKYLDQISSVIDILKVPYYSEHLAFTRVPGMELATLLPLPRTEIVAEFVSKKIKLIQNYLSVPFVIENIAYYFEYPDSTMSEGDFFSYICRATGAKILLDVQNLYVNSINLGLDSSEFINCLPENSVISIHIAGGEWIDDLLIDDHAHRVAVPALELVRAALESQSPDNIILERDNRLDQINEIQLDLKNIHSAVSKNEVHIDA